MSERYIRCMIPVLPTNVRAGAWLGACDPLRRDAALRAAGSQLVRLPAETPNRNAYADRVVRSDGQECL
jgi:hypothetical protein